MKYNGFDRQPDDEVLERLERPQRAIVLDKKELCNYLRRRLREECLGLPRAAKALNLSQPSLSNGFRGKYIKLDTLEALLYIVDGGTAKWREYCRLEGLDKEDIEPWVPARRRG